MEDKENQASEEQIEERLFLSDSEKQKKMALWGLAMLLLLAIFIVWIVFPPIRLSHKSSDVYTTHGPYEQTWSDSAGLHLSVTLLTSDNLAALPITNEQRALLEEEMSTHTIFWVQVIQDVGPNFIAVDFRPDLITLADDAGHQWSPRNQAVAAQTASPTLRAWLTALDVTISNEDQDQSKRVESLLLFDRVPPEISRLTLGFPKIFDFQLGVHSCEFTFDLPQ